MDSYVTDATDVTGAACMISVSLDLNVYVICFGVMFETDLSTLSMCLRLRLLGGLICTHKSVC